MCHHIWKALCYKWTQVQFYSSTFTKQECLYYLPSKAFLKDQIIKDQLFLVYLLLNALVCSTEWLLWQYHTGQIFTALCHVLKSHKFILLNFNPYFCYIGYSLSWYFSIGKQMCQCLLESYYTLRTPENFIAFREKKIVFINVDTIILFRISATIYKKFIRKIFDLK